MYPNSMPQRGVITGPGYSFDKLETINTANGNVLYTVPLMQLPPGRAGFSKPFSLIYNSQIYDLSTSFQATPYSSGNTEEVTRLAGSLYGGWRYGYQYALDLERKPGSATVVCTSTNPPQPLGQRDQFKLRLITPDGGPHELSIYGVARDVHGNGYYPYDPTGSGFCGDSLQQDMTYYTTDGTHIRVVVSQQGPTSGQDAWRQHPWTAYLPDGSTVTGLGGQTTSLSDRNGNAITVAAYTNPDGSPAHVLTDAFGRTITVQRNGLQDTITQTGFNGQTVTATVTWGGVAVDPSLQYQCSPAGYSCSAYGSPNNVMSVSIASPGNDTQTYSFGYSDPNVKGWGQLRTVQLPSGAKTTYSYQYDGQPLNYVSSAPTSLLNNPVVKKTVSWTDTSDSGSTQRLEETDYNFSISAQGVAFGGTIRYPDGGQESVFYCPVSASLVSLGTFMCFDQKPDGSKVEQQWAAQSSTGKPDQPGPPGNPYVQTTVKSVASASTQQPALAAVTAHTYDQNGNETGTTEYDWVPYSAIQHDGGGALTGFTPGTVLRTTQNTFQYTTPDSSSTADQSNTYWYPGAPSLLNLLTRSTVSGVGSGAIGAITEYAYDTTNGNLQHERRWDSFRAPAAPAAGSLDRTNAAVTDRLYDSYGNLKQITDPNGNVTSYTYDSNSLYLLSSVQGAGTNVALTTNYAYDSNSGLLTAQTDANNVQTCYSYDALGRTTSVTVIPGGSTDCSHSAGLAFAKTSTTYEDSNRRVIVRKDLNTAGDGALVTVTDYDQLGRVALTRQLENASQSADDDTVGIKVQTRYWPGNGSNRYQLVSNPYRAATSTAASAESTMGWTVTKLDQNGRVISSQSFDGSGLPSPWGNNTNSSGTVTTSYDAQATTVTDQAGTVRRSWTDGLGRLTEVLEDPSPSSGTGSHLNYITVYGYTALDDLTCVNQGSIGANNTCNTSQPHARQFIYDSLKRLTQATNPESGAISYTYDANGNLQTKTDANSIKTTYGVYDALNRATGKSYNDGKTQPVTYTYDDSKVPNAKGRLTQVNTQILAQNNTLIPAIINYTAYDALGRVTLSNEQIGASLYPFQYTYNLAGSLTSETYPSGRVVATCYDGANRAAQVSGSPTGSPSCTSTPSSGNTQTNYVTGLLYTPHGAPSQYLYGNTVGRSFQYNSRLQPTLIKDAVNYQDSALLLRLQPAWNSPGNSTDNNGNVRSVTEDNGTPGTSSLLSFTQTFTYDGVNRLSTASDTGGWSRSFGYDPYGNSCVGNPGGIGAPSAPACTQNSAGQWIVLPPGVYNNQNQLTVDASSYDGAGNLKTVNGDALGYDAENRQIGFTLPNGLGIGPETYGYDGNGNRVEKFGSGVTTTYVYDAFNQLKAEYSLGASSTSPCTPCYLSDDHLGSVRLVTKSDGTVLARHDYLPFGEEILGGQAGRSTPFGTTDALSQRFTGQQRDGESGLDYFGARYYGASLGRFMSPDPENTGSDPGDPQSWNAYAYVRNSPLTLTDPDGRDYQVCQGNTGGLQFNCVLIRSHPDSNGNQVEPFDQFAKENGLTIKAGNLYDRAGNQIGTAQYSDGADGISSLGLGVIQAVGRQTNSMYGLMGTFAGGSVLGGGAVAGGLALTSGSSLTSLGIAKSFHIIGRTR